MKTIVTYASETMCMKKKEENRLAVFQRKINRRIFLPVQTKEGEYMRMTNDEIGETLK